MSDDISIKVESLTKTYHLYDSPLDRLKESLSPVRRKYHHDFHALNDVSFEINKGETVGIIGKNGSGKSTLLKIISGVLTPTSGNVMVSGKISALLELGAGFNPELTGVENVYFNGTIMGYSKDEVDAKLDRILSFADIGEFVHQPVKNYSSGMFVRLAFAVAINIEPEVLIVDEALSVGDALFTAKCLSTIERFRQNGASILYVTHDTGSIKSLCSRAIYLDRGKVVEIGKAGNIADLYIRKLREESGLATMGKDPDQFLPVANEKDNVKLSSDIDPRVEPKLSNQTANQNGSIRYGSGEVRCVNAEILNAAGQPLTHVEFDEVIKIRLCLECYMVARFSVNYMIRDSRNMNLLGSNFRIEGVDFIQANPGDKYVVEYETRVPVTEGDYNLLVEITDPIILNHSAKFIDILENALVFQVIQRPEARLWSKVYVTNTVNINKID